MTPASWLTVGLFLVVAFADWVAVARGRRRAEHVLKPAALLLLIVVAVVIDPADSTQRSWFLVALAFSLAGDVFLMLEADRFLAGLAAFLLAHLAYVGGLALEGGGAGVLAASAAAVALVAVPLGLRIVRAAGARDRRLVVPVTAYIVVISVMVVRALATGDPVAASGALLFYASDALIGWSRFVGPVPSGRVAVMVTYHLGQLGLVVSLVH